MISASRSWCLAWIAIYVFTLVPSLVNGEQTKGPLQLTYKEELEACKFAEGDCKWCLKSVLLNMLPVYGAPGLVSSNLNTWRVRLSTAVMHRACKFRGPCLSIHGVKYTFHIFPQLSSPTSSPTALIGVLEGKVFLFFTIEKRHCKENWVRRVAFSIYHALRNMLLLWTTNILAVPNISPQNGPVASTIFWT